MNLDEAKIWLGPSYVFHPAYRTADHPNHSSYARVDVQATFERVGQQSFTSAVEQVRQRLRLIHGRAVA